jgi:hypothetical protein
MMGNIVLNVGNGLCWGASAFIGSPACHTQAEETSIGYLFFFLVALFIAWTLKRQLNRA